MSTYIVLGLSTRRREDALKKMMKMTTCRSENFEL